jgi:cation diffusion facilitator family transporter
VKSKLFLYISLLADLAIAAAKFTGAAFTGSASMISEGVHSVIDTLSQVLLIWGVKSSKKAPDARHPFGYGRQLYFWSFMVSLILFTLGGCISLYEGWTRFNRPLFEGNAVWNYVILAIAFVFNSISFIAARREFNKHRLSKSFWKAVIRTKDPSTIIVLLGDVADLLGLVVAFLGIFLGRLFHNPYFDGTASIIIGLILIFISALLIRESQSLLMGETIALEHLKVIIALVEADPGIVRVKKHWSIYRSPEDILLQLTAVFQDGLTTAKITGSIQNITKVIQAKYPHIRQLFIEPVPK